MKTKIISILLFIACSGSFLEAQINLKRTSFNNEELKKIADQNLDISFLQKNVAETKSSSTFWTYGKYIFSAAAILSMVYASKLSEGAATDSEVEKASVYFWVGIGSTALAIYSWAKDISGDRPVPSGDKPVPDFKEEIKPPNPSYPPILSIQDIEINKNIINAGETAQLIITVKNVGPGDAQNVYAEISSNTQGLSFPQKTNFDQIKKEGGTESITINIEGGLDLPSEEASLDIKIIEPYFKVNIQGKRLIFNTREFRKPEFVLAKFAVLENQSSSPNNRIDINEIIDVNFAIQNVGMGKAETVTVNVENTQKGVMFLGVKEGESLKRENPTFQQIDVGKYESITYSYFVNSEFTGNELRFTIIAKEKFNKFGLRETKLVPINTVLQEEGFIRQVITQEEDYEGKLIIEDIPDFEIDVRKDIPRLSKENPDAVAVIIGNKNYRKKDIPSVDYALEDASIMKQYLINTLGYREGNIIYFSNAAQGDMNSVFGTSSNYKGKLYNYVKEGKSDVFIYYSGHGAPDPESKQGYFVPVDCDPSTVSLNGYSLNTFYNNLSKINYKSLTVVIDACFSGSSEKGPLLKNISPVFITIDNQVVIKENTIIFTSSKGDQVSSWYPEKEHSLFTYYFLKGIQGSADINSDKKLTYKELSDYLLENVTYMARRLNNREQTPQVIGDKNKVLIEY